MPSSSNRNDPYSGFNFLIEIDGFTVAGFFECGGLSTEIDIIEYRNGDEEITVRKLPGLRKYTIITLKRGFTASADLWEWRKKVIDGHTERQSGAIVMQDEAREEVLRWNFREGWPCKWEGPALNAKNNEVAIESMEIAMEDIQLAP